MKRLLALAGLALAPVALAPALASAQVATVDEGSFTIFQRGARLGHEDFRIRRMPVTDSTSEYVASAVVAYGGRRLSPDLRTGTRGGPLAYTLESKTGAQLQERVSGQVGRGRFSAVRKTADGESSKEYALGEGAVILDDEVFSQYYFVGQGGRPGSFSVVCPRCSSQTTGRMEDRGSERLTIGGTAVDARHLVLHDAVGGDRELWVDARGRVLKVAIPSRDLIAIRDEAPRG
jgi:hypothetical protein